LNQLARRRIVAFTRYIRLRDDADESTIFFDHRQTANLMLRHDSQCLVKILLRVDRDDLLRRNLEDVHLFGISPLSRDANCDVAVRQHPDQHVALDDGRQPNVFLLHHLRGVRNRLVGVDGAWIGGHDVSET